MDDAGDYKHLRDTDKAIKLGDEEQGGRTNRQRKVELKGAKNRDIEGTIQRDRARGGCAEESRDRATVKTTHRQSKYTQIEKETPLATLGKIERCPTSE